jgi:hypothetical protein
MAANVALVAACVGLSACDSPRVSGRITTTIHFGPQNIVDGLGPCGQPVGVIHLPVGSPNAVPMHVWDVNCDGTIDHRRPVATPNVSMLPINAPFVDPRRTPTPNHLTPAPPPYWIPRDPPVVGFDYGLSFEPDFGGLTVDGWIAEHFEFLPDGGVIAPMGNLDVTIETPFAAPSLGETVTAGVTIYALVGMDDAPDPAEFGLVYYQAAWAGSGVLIGRRVEGALDDVLAFAHAWQPGGFEVNGVDERDAADPADDVAVAFIMSADGSYTVIVDGETVHESEG